MLKHQPVLGLSLVASLILFAGPSVAQQAQPAPAVEHVIQCGGQYECVEDRPMTATEAQASRSHPQNAQPQEVAAIHPTQSRPSANERREVPSAP
jgi:hypothetical protein